MDNIEHLSNKAYQIVKYVYGIYVFTSFYKSFFNVSGFISVDLSVLIRPSDVVTSFNTLHLLWSPCNSF